MQNAMTESAKEQMEDAEKLKMKNAAKERMQFVFEFVKTMSSLASAIGVLIAAGSLLLQKRSWEDYHERARSERAISLLADFSKALNPATRAAQKLEGNLGADNLAKLKNGESFSIDVVYVPLLQAAIGEIKLSGKRDRLFGIGSFIVRKEYYELTPLESFTLRWQIASYLNAVEVVCQARKSGVADATIIDAELRGMYDKSNRYNFCENYRRAVEGNDHLHYPAIHHFVSQILGDPTPINHIGGSSVAYR